MKTHLLFFATFLSFGVYSQSTFKINVDGSPASLSPNQVLTISTAAATNTKTTFDIRNTTASPQTFRAKRYDLVLHTAPDATQAEAYFCFAGSCYGSGVKISLNDLHLQPGKSASDTTIANPLAAFYMLIADLDEASTVGYSLVKYTFQNVNTPNDSIQISVKYNSQGVGISKVNNEVASFDVYPNPASESAFLKINALQSFDSKLLIYNSLGSLISEKTTVVNEGKNNVDLKIENLSPGLYFVSIKTRESSVTRRLIIK